MNLRDICQSAVATVTPDQSIREATWAMREHHVGDLVVVENRDSGRAIPCGILTDRDIVIDLLAEGVDDLDSERVGDVMSEDLVTVHIDGRPDDVVGLMQSEGIRRIPLVRDDGSLCGIVTLDDMLSYVTNHMAALADVVGAQIRHEVERDEP